MTKTPAAAAPAAPQPRLAECVTPLHRRRCCLGGVHPAHVIGAGAIGHNGRSGPSLPATTTATARCPRGDFPETCVGGIPRRPGTTTHASAPVPHAKLSSSRGEAKSEHSGDCRNPQRGAPAVRTPNCFCTTLLRAMRALSTFTSESAPGQKSTHAVEDAHTGASAARNLRCVCS